ncbi:MAG: PQ-loop domain-containing transporter [Pseudomonadota bacterium]
MAEAIVIAANLMQTAVPVLSLIAYIPQWLRLIKTKSSADIALSSWTIWIISSFFSTFYAVVQYQINGRGLPLIISSLSNLVFVILTVSLIALFRRPKKLS